MQRRVLGDGVTGRQNHHHFRFMHFWRRRWVAHESVLYGNESSPRSGARRYESIFGGSLTEGEQIVYIIIDRSHLDSDTQGHAMNRLCKALLIWCEAVLSSTLALPYC